MSSLPPGLTSLRRTDFASVVIQLAHGAAIAAILFVATPRQGLPVLATPAITPHPLATVDPAWAAVVLLLFSATVRLLAIGPLRQLYRSELETRRSSIRWVEYSQLAGVIVFLVGLMNGITEVGTLVLLYALGAGTVGFLALHERDCERPPFVLGAMIGIVPWGVIAFYQVGAIVAGGGPSIVVRVLTLSMLAQAALAWTLAYRIRSRSDPIHGERAWAVLTTITVSTFAWLVLLDRLTH